MVAVSQAPSPESNPDSPSPVTATVGAWPTIHSMIRQKLERYGAGAETMLSAQSYSESSQFVFADRGPIGFHLIKAPLPSSRGSRFHVLALELAGLSK